MTIEWETTSEERELLLKLRDLRELAATYHGAATDTARCYYAREILFREHAVRDLCHVLGVGAWRGGKST